MPEVTVAGHAYPWDVLGDPGFGARVRDHGIEGVTLAAAYHTVRAATPNHPAHRFVDAARSALYRPLRRRVWAGRRLVPADAPWTGAVDSFGDAVTALGDLQVTAWIVLTHNSVLAGARPDLAVTNFAGERYSYALCPSHAEVCDYAATLVAESIDGLPVAGVSLEACGQLGAVHGGHHDKTDGAYSDVAIRALSVCCCAGCRAAWRDRGLDVDQAIAALRASFHSGLAIDPQVADVLLAARHAAADAMRRQVVEAVRRTSPSLRVTLHASADPWATGASPGITPSAGAEVDAILAPAWPTAKVVADSVAAARAHAPVEAYVTLLSAEPEPALLDHVRRCVAAGATGIGAYHLGLAAPARQELFARIVSAASGGTP